MTDEWRSAAAQTFVGGQITQVDGYWRGEVVAANIFEMVSDWDLWDAAFGPKAKKVRDRWRAMLKLRNSQGSIAGVVRKVGAVVRGKDEVSMGTELFNDLKMDIVAPLQKLLDDTPLTINFTAKSWFENQAGFDEYTTTWDRKTTSASLNVNPDTKNPSHVRAKADRWALYGQIADSKARAQAAGMQMPHVKRTLGPDFKENLAYSDSGGKTDGVASDSMVFAALNYARRAHGSNTEYGKSVFELASGYKKNALYFAMDTFTPVSTGSGYKSKAERSKLYQITANTFGGAILLAIKSQYDGNKSPTNLQNSKELVIDLLQSARLKVPKADNKENHLLIEAHLFHKVRMNPAGVSSVRISSAECAGAPNLKANVTAFSGRTGVPVTYID